MTEQTIIVTNRVCKVCTDKFYYQKTEHPIMPDNSACFGCQFWIDKVKMAGQLDVARINGEHYVLGDGQSIFKGMGGIKHVIKFYDGRVKTCVDLWHQGTIPEHFRELLPDNAEFAEVA